MTPNEDDLANQSQGPSATGQCERHRHQLSDLQRRLTEVTGQLTRCQHWLRAVHDQADAIVDGVSLLMQEWSHSHQRLSRQIQQQQEKVEKQSTDNRRMWECISAQNTTINHLKETLRFDLHRNSSTEVATGSQPGSGTEIRDGSGTGTFTRTSSCTANARVQPSPCNRRCCSPSNSAANKNQVSCDHRPQSWMEQPLPQCPRCSRSLFSPDQDWRGSHEYQDCNSAMTAGIYTDKPCPVLSERKCNDCACEKCNRSSTTSPVSLLFSIPNNSRNSGFKSTSFEKNRTPQFRSVSTCSNTCRAFKPAMKRAVSLSHISSNRSPDCGSPEKND